ncbi:MAG TPA: DNA polymerase III subunit alpha [Burkholderiales bacterium]|jgi:DNA polymerase-3 subunit alpha|nr:DNA polymerase III subunit alpha [Burkholderiales bacterium]
MPAPAFVHLRLHSEYSVTDGLTRVDAAVAQAQGDGMGALALTDLANLFGMVKFYKAARGKGVKPVIGVDVWITNPEERDKPSRVILLAANNDGYLKLCELLSRAWLTNQHRGRAEIDKAWLREGTAGLIALSGLLLGPGAGDIAQALAAGNPGMAETLANEWAMLFPNRFYIEVQRSQAGSSKSAAVEPQLRRIVALAGRVKLPVVATHPVEFSSTEEFRAHEARVCIAEGYVLGDQRRPKLYSEDQYFKTQAEMAELFKDLPGALANSVEIAKRCNISLKLGKPSLPDFPVPAGLTIDEYMRQLSREGLKGRLEALYADAAKREAVRQRYEERLEFEVETIIKMGFPGYFLIVADFINWAKNNGVPVGPGRGSGAGSLVAYSLGITDLDPLAYNLLFERFLNPDRVSMPDFDIDFCENGRDKVIQYVRQKYGEHCVSQIATFGTMAAKAAIRDIGRVLDLGYNFCDGIAKLIPFAPGKLITIANAREMEPQLVAREKAEEEVAGLLSLAEQVEGLTRSVGKHAGGVLIAPGKLTDFTPLYAQGMGDGAVSQFDKDDVEAVGLVKFDFLGLTTLTVLDWAERYIRRGRPELPDFSCSKLPLDDAQAYTVFKKANTVAIFQFESRGMRDMLLGAKPDRFEDIIALVALYRPGPMDLIPDFIERKHGRQQVIYPDARVEPILSETYGIMVYQEQVMQMAQIMGGYSLGGADLLRRAMGKKKAEEMAEHRQIFRDGAAKNGLNTGKADEIFDLMEKFAGYGFNKSHAAAYALLAYHTAYLKQHYPAEFYAANMSCAMSDTDKVQIYAADARENGIEMLLPDVNLSAYRFEPVPGKNGKISAVRYGLGGIKGMGEGAIENILAARAEKQFTDLFDFCARVDKRLVNRRAVEALVRAGGFDALEADRAVLFASVGIAMEAAEQAEQSADQVSLFGGTDEGNQEHKPELVRTLKWSTRERLLNEKLALGYYLSGHLFDAYAAEVRKLARTRLIDVKPRGEPQLLAGVVTQMRSAMTRRGKMNILEIDDGSAKLEVTVFQELVDAHRDLLKPDELLVISGKVREDQFSGGVRISAEKLYGMVDLRRAYARTLKVSMNGQANAKKLMELLAPYRGGGSCPVVIDYHNGDASCEIPLGEEWRVTPREELLQGLRDWLTPAGVEVLY